MPVYEKKHLKSCFKTSFGIYTSLSIQKEYQVIFFICNLFSDFFFFARALTTSLCLLTSYITLTTWAICSNQFALLASSILLEYVCISRFHANISMFLIQKKKYLKLLHLFINGTL